MDDQLFQLGKELIDIVQDIFPSDAEFCCRQNDFNFMCSICWKLKTDLARPNKPSKIISIKISMELLEDYRDSHDSEKENAKKGFKKLIKSKFSEFNPDHNNPKYQTPPIEEWFIGTQNLQFR